MYICWKAIINSYEIIFFSIFINIARTAVYSKMLTPHLLIKGHAVVVQHIFGRANDRNANVVTFTDRSPPQHWYFYRFQRFKQSVWLRSHRSFSRWDFACHWVSTWKSLWRYALNEVYRTSLMNDFPLIQRCKLRVQSDQKLFTR